MPSVAGTIRFGASLTEAHGNVLDALGEMLAVEPASVLEVLARGRDGPGHASHKLVVVGREEVGLVALLGLALVGHR